MAVDGLELSRSGETLTVELSRGEGNLFTTEMTAALREAVLEAERDRELRFVRLRSRGPAFCLGREREGETVDELRAVATRIVAVGEALREVPAIVVCEVGGDAAGFGVGLVASSDVAIASEEAGFSFPELEAGFAPAVVLAWLARLVPRKVAFELVASGRRFTAAEARELGLVTEVVGAGEVGAAADRWLKRLRNAESEALRDVKEFLRRAEALDERAAGRAAADLLTLGSLRLPGAR